MSERNPQLSCCEQYGRAFSAWDLRLYLDTHPDDTQALALFSQMYADADGDAYPFRGIKPCDADGGMWRYLDGPWPWEPEANCDVTASHCGKGGR